MSITSDCDSLGLNAGNILNVFVYANIARFHVATSLLTRAPDVRLSFA